MKRPKTTGFAIAAWVGLGALAACGSTASAPDIDVMSSEPTAAAMGQSSLTVAEERHNRGDGALGVVYVTSQGLYFDTFVSAKSLPFHGRFQGLDDGVTEFGPGDPGYLGGRWWVDSNGDNMMDAGDTFLLCPLLPPGRPSP